MADHRTAPRAAVGAGARLAGRPAGLRAGSTGRAAAVGRLGPAGDRGQCPPGAGGRVRRGPSRSGAAAFRQCRLSAAAGPARARGPGPGCGAVRRRPPDRPAARTAHGQRGADGPPQVDIPAVLRAGGAPGRPDRADVVRHRAAGREPLRRLCGAADPAGAGGDGAAHRSADGAAVLPHRERRPSCLGGDGPGGGAGHTAGADPRGPGPPAVRMALYVDFAATEEDWAAYGSGWGRPDRS